MYSVGGTLFWIAETQPELILAKGNVIAVCHWKDWFHLPESWLPFFTPTNFRSKWLYPSLLALLGSHLPSLLQKRMVDSHSAAPPVILSGWPDRRGPGSLPALAGLDVLAHVHYSWQSSWEPCVWRSMSRCPGKQCFVAGPKTQLCGLNAHLREACLGLSFWVPHQVCLIL